MSSHSFSLSLMKLANAWWRGDRVRVFSPEQRIWSLQPGSLLTIREEDVEVLSRTVHAEPTPGIEFECRRPQGTGLLKAFPITETPCLRMVWNTAEGEIELSISDVQIWR